MYKATHEFSIGVGYSSISYQPKKVIEYADNKSFWLDDIHYDQINLPITYKYHIKKNKFSIYPTIGCEMNLTINNKYSFLENSNQETTTLPIDKIIGNSEYSASLYAKKEYYEGVADGGNTSDNISLNALVGFGVSKNLNKDFILYIEPYYQYTFFNNKFGPNHDKINSLKFKIGIQKFLNR
ncbi:MAG: hypothetical protein R2771_16080 [Saprospiraceae bacterium]